MKQFGSFAGLDNQRSLFLLLERLGSGASPEKGCARRRDYLAWCCRQSKGPGGKPPLVAPSTVGLSREVYLDIVSLAAQFSLDLENAAITLERLVRRYEKAPVTCRA